MGDSPLWLFRERELRRLNAEASVLADEQIAGMPEAPLAEVVAARKDASSVAELLLRQGAYIHAKNNKGWTLLHDAAWKDASETAEVLRRWRLRVK